MNADILPDDAPDEDEELWPERAILDEERWEAARARLRELAATFPQPGPNDLQGHDLVRAWYNALMELPKREREGWINEYGYLYRVAVGLQPAPRDPSA